MANPNAPFGARIVGHLYDSSYVARPRQYLCNSDNSETIGIGDFVVNTGTGATSDTGEVLPTIALATNASTAILGIVVGFQVDPTNLDQIYRSPSTLRVALVVDDPLVIYEIQASGTAFNADMFEQNAKLSIGTVNPLFGVSGTTLNLTTVTSSSDQIRIIGVKQESNNLVGDYTRLICFTNQHVRRAFTGV